MTKEIALFQGDLEVKILEDGEKIIF